MGEFHVRARAVDMLGRQQIAGIPTAIHELFKNAHDAYAERVEVDYFRSQRLFVMRDDGLGMTLEDIEEKWLTLGTEHRLGANEAKTEIWTGPKQLPRRTIMGEKGIGRLAIAAIGPIALVITRAVRRDGLCPAVAVLVHWSLFEQPGIDVSSIPVPIRETPADFPPEITLIEMIEEVREKIEELRDQLGQSEAERLISELETLRPVNLVHLDRFLNQNRSDPLSLSKDGHGTWFVVTPSARELDDDIDNRPEGMGTSNFNKVLLGFANTMDKEYKPVISTKFRDHRPDGTHSLIGPTEFFSADDFQNLDHLIEGEFNERGQFNGRLSFYGSETREFVLNWTAGKGRVARCGPFRFRLGVLQGRKKESRLDEKTHAIMLARLNELGGLYIYTDGIRVLPYGTSENDFIGIEMRRTLAAKDWYFSYRRMIGFVALSHSANPNLSEKAGREGFRQNYAYRDLKSVLEEFVRSVAVRFFRASSEEGLEFQEQKDEYVREREALVQRNKRIRERRRDFAKQLAVFRKAVDEERFEQETELLLTEFSRRLKAIENEEDDSIAADYILKVRADVRSEISKLASAITIRAPRGLPLTKSLKREFAAYKRIFPMILDRTVGRLESEISDPVDLLTQKRISEQLRRDAAVESLQSRKSEFVRDVTAEQKQARQAAESLQATLKQVLGEELRMLRNQFEVTIDEYSAGAIENAAQIEESWKEVETKLRSMRDGVIELVEAIRRQLSEFKQTVISRTTMDDALVAVENRLERLEEQLEFQSELAQVGMAVGILGHEFNHTIALFREAIHELRQWADGTPDLQPLYANLRRSFENLEGYLQVLTPLGRRLTRRKVKISGSEIELYIRRIFSRRLQDEDVRLVSSPGFGNHVVKCRTAALLSAFVNVVDNALYWIAQERQTGGAITLDATAEAFLISNNGPGVSELDAERIFEFGWTSKPGGAGMGLALARDALANEGFKLELRQAGKNRNPVFAVVTEVADDQE